MSWDDINNAAQELADQALVEATEVTADALGLDIRAGYRIMVGEDFLAVQVDRDRSLQYYGGFEYVAPEYRMELGGWVFYSIEDERVHDHWEQSNER